MLLNHICLTLFISLMILKTLASNSTFENANDMKEIMLADIESAFKSITNVTEVMLHDKIIPEMYNLTRSHTFIFKVPDMKTKLGYAMITTDRSELMQPIFPNLTMNSEQVMLKKRRLQTTVRNSEGTHNVEVFNNNAYIWSSLGLDGWSGELAIATDSLEHAHKDVKDVKPHTTQALEKNKLNETVLKFERTTEIIPTLPNTTFNDDLSENIYIARVNDPFGLSTKWSYRNQSINATNEIAEDKRPKRDIVELYSMLKCATGCEPLLYQSYGCFCGFLGRGIAVDGIDSCCRMHDKCYEHSNCVSYLQYFVPYVWKCYHGKPLCALDHGEYGGPTSCAALLCYCDMRLSICLRKYQCPLRKAVCNTSLARKLQNLFL